MWNRIALVAGIFALLICVLLTANYIQVKKSDPVNMTVINSLVERLYANPGDSALRNEIRTLDLLSRKAYFTSQWQIKTGGYLLLALVALVVISLQIVEYRKKINPVVSAGTEDESMEQRRLARKWIVTGGSVILLVAVVFAVLASNDLSDRFTRLSNGEVPAADNTSLSESVPVETDTTAITADTTLAGADSAVTATAVVSKDNFPNFRGTAGMAFKKNIPVSWDGSKGTNVLWKTSLPLHGYSSPVIWGDKVFLTGATAEKQELYCIDRNSGKLLWTVKTGTGAKKPKVSAETGYSAPTAVTDGSAVYAIFPTGDVVAADMEGKKIWERDLGLPRNHYGHSSSLLLHGGNVLVQYDQTNAPKVMALSVKDGKTVWSTDRPVKVSWASPILVNTGKRSELILAAEPYLAAYNPATGKELWKIEGVSGEVGPSPAYANGIVFAVNDYSRLCAIRVGDAPSLLWENNEILSDIPSPAANDKYLFLATSYGVLVCYDAVTGEKYWEKDLGSPVFSSPMIVEGKVYVLDRSGLMHIVLADKALKVVAEPKLGEEVACTPAFTNGRIYIRGEEHLYCIGK
jgi:outer membrane protein assembly factor BamB